MTLDQWLDRTSGYTVKLDAGTTIGRRWVSAEEDRPGHSVDVVLEADAFVTISIDHGGMWALVRKAIFNKSRRASDGPLTVRLTKAQRVTRAR